MEQHCPYAESDEKEAIKLMRMSDCLCFVIVISRRPRLQAKGPTMGQQPVIAPRQAQMAQRNLMTL